MSLEQIAVAHVAEIIAFIWWAGGLATDVKWLKSEIERMRDHQGGKG